MTRPIFGQPYTPGNFARLTPSGTDLAFESTFNRAMVDAMKARIPAEARSWDRENKRWLVSAPFAGVCAAVAREFLGVDLAVPKVSKVSTVETRVLRVEYLGACKDRSGSSTANGASGPAQWTVVFPESVLREWFEATKTPTEFKSLYEVLAVKQSATSFEILSAYRRLAKIWHPDASREPGTAEQFKRINRAYEQLKEPLSRKKYDAGLYFEAQSKPTESVLWRKSNTHTLADVEYRSPLRSGWIMAEGTESIGRFIVSKLIDWQDIVDAAGRVMVCSWQQGAESYTVLWS